MTRTIILAALGIAAAHPAAAAGTINGSGGLAMAALVGAHSPITTPADKKLLARLFGGDLALANRTKYKITVKADSVVCRQGNVDVTLHECTLKFGTRSVQVNGIDAYALFATLALGGVPSDGAAGSVYESVTKLSCVIDPAQLSGGGGAECSFQPGP